MSLTLKDSARKNLKKKLTHIDVMAEASKAPLQSRSIHRGLRKQKPKTKKIDTYTRGKSTRSLHRCHLTLARQLTALSKFTKQLPQKKAKNGPDDVTGSDWSAAKSAARGIVRAECKILAVWTVYVQPFSRL